MSPDLSQVIIMVTVTMKTMKNKVVILTQTMIFS